MKIFKHRNFMSLIFSVIVSLPFLSILSRSAYVAVNKNAKESYYGETINQSENIYTNANDLVLNQIYTFENPILDGLNNSNPFSYIYISEFKNANFTLEDTPNTLAFYTNNTGKGVIRFIKDGTTITSKYLNSDLLKFDFEFLGRSSLTNNSDLFAYNLFYQIEYNKYSYLDNAFDYSISRFVDENHWGKLNFFEWFNNLFIDINSNNNTLYLHFINWYMNYFLMVSCAYILFLVLMWFINYSRRLLERGMNYDW